MSLFSDQEWKALLLRRLDDDLGDKTERSLRVLQRDYGTAASFFRKFSSPDPLSAIAEYVKTLESDLNAKQEKTLVRVLAGVINDMQARAESKAVSNGKLVDHSPSKRVAYVCDFSCMAALMDISKIPGLSIPYVRPKCFEDAYAYLSSQAQDLGCIHQALLVETQKDLLSFSSFIKSSNNLIIQGASGSGKTRIGYELAKQLALDAANYGVGRVAYLYIPRYAIDGMENPKHVKDMDNARPLFASLIAGSVTGELKAVPSTVSLHDLLGHAIRVSSLNGEQSQASLPQRPEIVVVHLDEYQTAPVTASAFLRCIRDFNLENRPVKIVPILTGLAAGDVEVEYGATDVQTIVQTLGFFAASAPEVWELVKGAERACVGSNTYIDLAAAPRLMRYLVEDVFGWPQAAVHLGFALGVFRLSGQNPSSQSHFHHIEGSLEEFLRAKYRELSLVPDSSMTSAAGLRKLLLLAMSPASVHRDESIFGGLQELRKLGVVDIQPEKAVTGSKQPDSKRYHLRMSKHMMAIINNIEGVGVIDGAFLKTVRDYFATSQECAQLMSMLIGIQAILSLEIEAPSLTLKNIRPGALFVDLSGQNLAEKPLDISLADVRLAEDWLSSRQKIEELSAVNSKQKYGLLKTNHEAHDAWIRLSNRLYVMQSKGRHLKSLIQKTRDDTMRPSEIISYCTAMAASIQPKGGSTKQPVGSEEMLGFELISTQSAPSRFELLPHHDQQDPHHDQQDSGQESAPKKQRRVKVPTEEGGKVPADTHPKRLPGLPPGFLYTLITKDDIQSALGPVFAGVVGRMLEAEKTAEKELWASGAKGKRGWKGKTTQM